MKKRKAKVQQFLDRHEQIIDFIENFRLLQLADKPGDSTLISIRIPNKLLAAFKAQSEFEGIKYQSKIKELMLKSLKSN